MVVEGGVTVKGVPVIPPGFHKNVVPTISLLADKEAVSPVQIAAGMAMGEMIGVGLTFTVTVSVPVQPAAVPVTVKVVVIPGVTETGVPAKLPGFHIKVVPTIVLLAFNEEDSPLHIVVGVAVEVITGFGLTDTSTVAVPVQPATSPPVTV
jgi:hypothetical protein